MIRDILKERGDRYGVFSDHASICQDLKDTMRKAPSWSICTASQKQALEVIADKIARMLNGDPNYDDNWVDIIGYSQLVLDELHEHKGQTKMDFTSEYNADDDIGTFDRLVDPLRKDELTFAEHTANQRITLEDHEAGDS